MATRSVKPAKDDASALLREEIRQLRAGLAAMEAANNALREQLGSASRLHATDVHNLADLLASEVALASSKAETKLGRADLRASEDALASSQEETKLGQTNLLASEGANKDMGLANDLLISANAALLKSEERFRRLIESAPSAMVMINAGGRIEMVNAQTELLFGYTRAELLGAAVEMLLPAESRPDHPKLRTDFFATSTSRPMGVGRDVFGLKKDGTKVEVEIGLSPFETDEGMMVLSTIVDISQRVRLAGQIRQSQKMHAIGRVTAGVAHDFNNLLMVVAGNIELLLDLVEDQPVAIVLGRSALNATARGKELTDRLLSFSRKQLLRAKPVSINALFSELNGLIGPMFQTSTKARIELVLLPSSPDLAVLADAAQLHAALINLAVNARDAMAAGGCLRITAYDTEADPTIVPPGRYTVISVADTGCGMDASTLAQACEPFFTTKGVSGTGLGLSMVHGFARQSGGEAHITSIPGEGTTIDLWLPSASTIADHDAVAAPHAPPPPERILLVDDSEDVLLVSAAFLRFSGLDVTGTLSGDLALAELAAGRRFDVLITDFAMPGMNGMELLTLAREVDPTMLGMIITGFSDPELLSELNGIVVLRKPFNRAELTATVRKLIGENLPSTRTRQSGDIRAPGRRWPGGSTPG